VKVKVARYVSVERIVIDMVINMKNIMITVPKAPVSASRPRVPRYGKPYYNEPYNTYKQYLKDYMKMFMFESKNLVYPKYEPLHIDIIFYMEIPKSTSKKKALTMEGLFHVKKPDKDNLEKAVLDSMNGVVYHDDGQVCSSTVKKIYSSNPRTEINITSLELGNI